MTTRTMGEVTAIALVLGALLAACNYTEGMCHPAGEGGTNDGAAGGVISPNGSGGFGDVPPSPKPQDASGTTPPDCMVVPPDPCHQKCLTDYENRAVQCGQIQDQSARQACNLSAYYVYKACKDACQTQNNCLEHCKDLCYEIMDKCKGDCKNAPNVSDCRAKCSDEYGKCLKECDNKCK